MALFGNFDLGVRIHTEVRRRVEKLFDFTRFAALEAEKRENEEPYRLLIQKKGLHSTQTIPREEVLPDSDEVLHTVMMENRVRWRTKYTQFLSRALSLSGVVLEADTGLRYFAFFLV